MFRSAVLKLTSWYVGALIAVCLVFSIPIYGIVSARLQHGAERQTEFVRDLPDPFAPRQLVPELVRMRDQQVANDRREVVISLLIINGVIIGFGAYASYLFARRTLRPIEQAHAAQARFTADASHELRTPLAVMQTEIEVALRDKKLTTVGAKDILASNLEEVARLRQLSDQLLGLTRADAEPIKLDTVNLTKLAQEQAELLGKRYKLAITVEAPEDISVTVDKLLLTQVMGIIVDNAVAYSGLPDPELTVRLTTTKDRALLSISNRGKSIAEKDREHIFDRFYRGKNASADNPKGHGLGLALAKDIIERQGGTIAVTSKSRSTVFTISLSK